VADPHQELTHTQSSSDSEAVPAALAEVAAMASTAISADVHAEHVELSGVALAPTVKAEG
jgi:hypothetical protein